jgi:GTP pyrophosphokinase
MSPTKQFKITGETLYIYAPLAHRLGLFAIKTELEELCFKYEHPETFADLTQKIEITAPQRNKIYENFSVPVVESLDKMGIEYEMHARVKSVYSIWNKMQKKGIEFNEVYDLFAVRIVFELTHGIDEKKRCWDIYSAITDIYKLRPDRIRDWVSHPKANGYQALHLTVMGPDGKWIEIQIRSRRMDDIAEKGFAAHWKYKEGKIEEDNELEKWLKTIQEILSNPNPNAIDFLDTVKMNLFSSEIFVFTPKGEIKTLPQGATALDFAYSIHTRIGDHCLGAKINHTLVPLSQKLSSGDQIEILTSQSVHPQPEWLNFVSTAKARTKIEASLRRQRRRIVEKGENMLYELFGNEPIDNTTFNKIMNVYNAENKEDLYFLIGNNEIILPQDKQVFIKVKEEPDKSENLFVRYMKQAMSAIKKPSSDHKTKDREFKESNDFDEFVEKKGDLPLNTILRQKEKINRKSIYRLEENNFIKNFIILSCCNPLPGDDVFGYVTENEEVEVHKRSCQNGLRIKSNHGDKIINVAWGDYRQYSFLASIVFTGIDRVGILGLILAKLAEDVIVNIQSVNVSTNDGIFEGVFNVHVHSAEEVNLLCAKIAKVNGVSTVHRLNL